MIILIMREIILPRKYFSYNKRTEKTTSTVTVTNNVIIVIITIIS